MQLRNAIQEFVLEFKVRRLVPRTIDNYGKHLRYLTDFLAEECQLEKLEDIKSAHIKKFLLMKEEQGNEKKNDSCNQNNCFCMKIYFERHLHAVCGVVSRLGA